LGILILAGLQLLLTMQLRIHYEPVAESVVHGAEQLNPALFQSMSFGQIGAAIDWAFLKCLQDPTIEHVKKGEHLEIYYDLDLVTTLDPLFFQAYVFGANLLAIVHDDGEGALELLLKGEKFRATTLKDYSGSFRDQYWPNEWQLPLLLAYTYLFEVDNMPKATDAYEEAASLPGAPVYLQGLVKRFRAKDGEYEVGLRLLDFLLSGQKEPAAREKLLRRKYSLQVKKYVFDTNQKFNNFLESHKIQKTKQGNHNPSEKDLARMKQLWSQFLVKSATSDIDPWNGSLSINDSGVVVTSTPHDKVFGLE
jgi:hypothetical protein